MTEPPREIALFKRMYREFNARNIDAVTGVMHADVTWPNGRVRSGKRDGGDPDG